MAAAEERFDLKLEREEKELLNRAAAASGMSLSAFMRSAAKARADEVLQRETRIQLSQRDFDAFVDAMDRPFAPNDALRDAMESAARDVRRRA